MVCDCTIPLFKYSSVWYKDIKLSFLKILILMHFTTCIYLKENGEDCQMPEEECGAMPVLPVDGMCLKHGTQSHGILSWLEKKML